MIKKYKAKVSFGLIIFVFLVFFVPLIPDILKGELNRKLIIFLLVIFATILYFFFNTKYIIENNMLKIKFGFISYKPIEVDKIKEIAKTRNPISSPAPSLDRIIIKYGKYDEVIISPKNKLDFAKYLTKLNPKINNKLDKYNNNGTG